MSAIIYNWQNKFTDMYFKMRPRKYMQMLSDYIFHMYQMNWKIKHENN